MDNYRELNKTILYPDFPIELLILKGKSLKRVVTIYSSSVSSFIGVCDVIFLGTNKYKELFELEQVFNYEEHLLER